MDPLTNPDLKEEDDELLFRFAKAFEKELTEISGRRKLVGFEVREGKDKSLRQNLVGLALSGGGIRSATFCLGLLQKMHEMGLLRIFDYLSTVSGGGYLGSWWSAWLARPQFGGADLRQSEEFAKVLLAANDPLSKFICDTGFSDRTRMLFGAPPGRPGYSECMKKEGLARALNRVIEGECIYEPARFEHVVLREQTKRLFDLWREHKTKRKELGRSQQVWLNRLLLEDAYRDFLERPIFPPAERSEPEREEDYLPPAETSNGIHALKDVHAIGKLAEGSRSAGSDPAHHLRLFANYLTPRKGLLSDDTWRMVAVFTRNLTMTWLILLPVLVAVVLVGQLYYVLQPGSQSSFINYPRPGQVSYLPNRLEVAGPNPEETRELLPMSRARTLQSEAVSDRVGAAAKPLFLITGWIVLMGVLWLVCSIDKEKIVEWIVVAAGMLAVAAVTISVTSVYLPSAFFSLYHARRWVYVWALVDVALILYVMWRPRGEPPGADLKTKIQWRKEVRASKITRLHGKLLVTLVLTTFVLALSGFGHEIVLFPYYFFDPNGSGTLDFLAKNIGWFLLLLSAVTGSIFTAHKTRSSNGKQEINEPSVKGRLVLAATPPLVVTALAVGVAWIGQWLIEEIWVIITQYPESQILRRLTLAAFISVILCFIFAVFDMKWRRSCPSTGLLVTVTVLAFTLSLAVNALAAQTGGVPFVEAFVVVVVGIGELLLILRLSAVWRNSDRTRSGFVANRVIIWSGGDRRNLLVWIVAIVCAAIAAFFFKKYLWFLEPNARGAAKPVWFLILPLIVVTLTGGLLLFRLAVTRDIKTPFRVAIFKELGALHHGRALYLLASICLLLAVSIDCGIHALVSSHTRLDDTLLFLQLPILVAILAGAVFLLRVAAVEIGEQESDRSSEDERSILRNLTHLMVGLRWIADRFEGNVGNKRGAVEWVRDRREALLMLVASTCVLFSVGLGWSMHMPGEKVVTAFTQSSWTLTPILLGLWLVVLKTAVVRLKKVANAGPSRGNGTTRKWALKHKSALLWGLATSCVIVAVWTGWVARAVVSDAANEYHGTSMALTSPTFIGIVLCVTFVIFEMKWGEGENRRSLWLLTAAYLVLVALLIVSMSEQSQMTRLVQSVIGLIAAALAWVVGLGWMADPNAYSMHLFYKARLVRAYLGASNFNRLKQQKEITEAVAGDNVLLKEMRNCGRGAPYHLINTTLNLVAARDLATAQRSAASFVLSQLHCGSSRTGYRTTKKYMGGRLTLGTAVAVSGAATSPNMGSRTPTAALAMLMTLLNVRLGYWAPTPKNPDWKSPRARLWPFYLLREFLSHTNDVSDYCYLTDGGHFDNTGLYSLVERGCRFIVVADCGADPEPSFSDLGNAIRRCHIDFKAEIELNITPFKRLIENRATQHFVKGKIVYSKAHAKALGWGELENEDERTGTIILVKPSLLSDKKSDETADVRQYAIQNSDFPQQTTTKQWFDEAQFESYRRLGEICAQSVFCDLDASGNARAKDAAVRIKGKIERRAPISSRDIRELFHDAPANGNPSAHPPKYE